MCKPTYFDVKYEINPWMNKNIPVDKEKARAEWENLYQTIVKLGAEVSLIEPVEGLPDMVFASEGGLAKGKQVVMSNMKVKERQEETKHYEENVAKGEGENNYLKNVAYAPRRRVRAGCLPENILFLSFCINKIPVD